MLLTSTEVIITWWKEYFEDVLVSTDMLSVVEVESGDEGDTFLGWTRFALSS